MFRYTIRVSANYPAHNPAQYPGEKYGFPAQGRGSAAPIVRRLGAIFIDWGIAYAISLAVFRGDPWATLAIYSVQCIVLLPTLGYTVGYRICGILLMNASGNKCGFFAVCLRHILACLVIPALIYNYDRRGLHDLAAKTFVVLR